MKWFFPAFNGDFRLEPDGPGVCVIKTIKPTAHEQELLRVFMGIALKKKWVSSVVEIGSADQAITLQGSMEKVGPALVKATKPRDRTLTAVVFKDGKVETAVTEDSRALSDLAAKTTSTTVPNPAKAAASVSRPTPCCPQCITGAVEPATEVLLSFLSPEEHEQWASERALVVHGGMSGHRYLLAHRHTARARRVGRICFDLAIVRGEHAAMRPRNTQEVRQLLDLEDHASRLSDLRERVILAKRAADQPPPNKDAGIFGQDGDGGVLGGAGEDPGEDDK